MLLGILGYTSVVIAGLIYFETGHSRTIILLAGCILGTGAALLWTGQGRLILDYSNDENRGQLFAVFWALYRCASLMGGILSFTYFSIEGNDAGSTSLYIIFLILMLIGAGGTFLLKSPETVSGSSASLDNSPPSSSWVTEMTESLYMFGTTEMLYLSVMFFASGSNEPYALSTFTRFFDKKALGMEMIIFYTGSVTGSFFCGKLLDASSKKMREERENSNSQAGIYKASTSIVILFSAIHACAFAIAAVVETNSW
jgi:hypothetical protein